VTDTLPGHTAQVSRLAFLPSSSSENDKAAALITGDEAGNIIFWTPTTSSYEIAQSIPAHKESISALSGINLTSNESWILSGGSDAVVHIWQWIRSGDEPGGEYYAFARLAELWDADSRGRKR
jgi:WD40 repeat protein